MRKLLFFSVFLVMGTLISGDFMDPDLFPASEFQEGSFPEVYHLIDQIEEADELYLKNSDSFFDDLNLWKTKITGIGEQLAALVKDNKLISEIKKEIARLIRQGERRFSKNASADSEYYGRIIGNSQRPEAVTGMINLLSKSGMQGPAAKPWLSFDFKTVNGFEGAAQQWSQLENQFNTSRLKWEQQYREDLKEADIQWLSTFKEYEDMQREWEGEYENYLAYADAEAVDRLERLDAYINAASEKSAEMRLRDKEKLISGLNTSLGYYADCLWIIEQADKQIDSGMEPEYWNKMKDLYADKALSIMQEFAEVFTFLTDGSTDYGMSSIERLELAEAEKLKALNMMAEEAAVFAGIDGLTQDDSALALLSEYENERKRLIDNYNILTEGLSRLDVSAAGLSTEIREKNEALYNRINDINLVNGLFISGDTSAAEEELHNLKEEVKDFYDTKAIELYSRYFNQSSALLYRRAEDELNTFVDRIQESAGEHSEAASYYASVLELLDPLNEWDLEELNDDLKDTEQAFLKDFAEGAAAISAEDKEQLFKIITDPEQDRTGLSDLLKSAGEGAAVNEDLANEIETLNIQLNALRDFGGNVSLLFDGFPDKKLKSLGTSAGLYYIDGDAGFLMLENAEGVNDIIDFAGILYDEGCPDIIFEAALIMIHNKVKELSLTEDDLISSSTDEAVIDEAGFNIETADWLIDNSVSGGHEFKEMVLSAQKGVEYNFYNSDIRGGYSSLIDGDRALWIADRSEGNIFTDSADESSLLHDGPTTDFYDATVTLFLAKVRTIIDEQKARIEKENVLNSLFGKIFEESLEFDHAAAVKILSAAAEALAAPDGDASADEYNKARSELQLKKAEMIYNKAEAATLEKIIGEFTRDRGSFYVNIIKPLEKEADDIRADINELNEGFLEIMQEYNKADREIRLAGAEIEGIERLIEEQNSLVKLKHMEESRRLLRGIIDDSKWKQTFTSLKAVYDERISAIEGQESPENPIISGELKTSLNSLTSDLQSLAEAESSAAEEQGLLSGLADKKRKRNLTFEQSAERYFNLDFAGLTVEEGEAASTEEFFTWLEGMNGIISSSVSAPILKDFILSRGYSNLGIGSMSSYARSNMSASELADILDIDVDGLMSGSKAEAENRVNADARARGLFEKFNFFIDEGIIPDDSLFTAGARSEAADRLAVEINALKDDKLIELEGMNLGYKIQASLYAGAAVLCFLHLDFVAGSVFSGFSAHYYSLADDFKQKINRINTLLPNVRPGAQGSDDEVRNFKTVLEDIYKKFTIAESAASEYETALENSRNSGLMEEIDRLSREAGLTFESILTYTDNAAAEEAVEEVVAEITARIGIEGGLPGLNEMTFLAESLKSLAGLRIDGYAEVEEAISENRLLSAENEYRRQQNLQALIAEASLESWNRGYSEIRMARREWLKARESEYAAALELWDSRAAELSSAEQDWLNNKASDALVTEIAAPAGINVAVPLIRLTPPPGAGQFSRETLRQIERAASAVEGMRSSDPGQIGLFTSFSGLGSLGSVELLQPRPGMETALISVRQAVYRDVLGDTFNNMEEARNQLEAQVDTANADVSRSITDNFINAGFIKTAGNFIRDVVTSVTLTGQKMYSQMTAVYADYEFPGWDNYKGGTEDYSLYTAAEFSRVIAGIKDSIMEKAEEIFGRGGDSAEAQDGLFQLHVGRVPETDDNMEFTSEGSGELGRIYSDLIKFEMEMGNSISLMKTPFYDRNLWHDDSFIKPVTAGEAITAACRILGFTILPGAGNLLAEAVKKGFLLSDVKTGRIDPLSALLEVGKSWAADTLISGSSNVFKDIYEDIDPDLSVVDAAVAHGATSGTEVWVNSLLRGFVSTVSYNEAQGLYLDTDKMADEIIRLSLPGEILSAGTSAAVDVILAEYISSDFEGEGFIYASETRLDLEKADALRAQIASLGGTVAAGLVTGDYSFNVLNLTDFDKNLENYGLMELHLGKENFLKPGAGGMNISFSSISTAVEGAAVSYEKAEILEDVASAVLIKDFLNKSRERVFKKDEILFEEVSGYSGIIKSRLEVHRRNLSRENLFSLFSRDRDGNGEFISFIDKNLVIGKEQDDISWQEFFNNQNFDTRGAFWLSCRAMEENAADLELLFNTGKIFAGVNEAFSEEDVSVRTVLFGEYYSEEAGLAEDFLGGGFFESGQYIRGMVESRRLGDIGSGLSAAVLADTIERRSENLINAGGDERKIKQLLKTYENVLRVFSDLGGSGGISPHPFSAPAGEGPGLPLSSENPLRVTTLFGYRLIDSELSGVITGEQGEWSAFFHQGIDISAGYGDGFYAVHEGSLSLDYTRAKGLGIKVESVSRQGQEVSAACYHASEESLKRYGYEYISGGGRVERGALLGTTGMTGSSSGGHVHFELSVDGSYTDPLSMFRDSQYYITDEAAAFTGYSDKTYYADTLEKLIGYYDNFSRENETIESFSGHYADELEEYFSVSY